MQDIRPGNCLCYQGMAQGMAEQREAACVSGKGFMMIVVIDTSLRARRKQRMLQQQHAHANTAAVLFYFMECELLQRSCKLQGQRAQTTRIGQARQKAVT